MLKMRVNIMMKNYKHSCGFTMVEILVAMVIGMLVMSGAFALHSGTRTTQKMNEAQMDMVADARFAIEMISHDLRHSSMWGGTNKDELITCKSTDDSCDATPAGVVLPTDAAGAVTNDCANLGPVWAYDLSQSVFATDGSVANPYGATCLSGENHLAGTDILEIKYADSNAPPTGIMANQAYIRSNFENGKIFIGDTQPIIDRNDAGGSTGNHVLHAYVYYVSSNTDASDGIPSLRRASLVNGPKMQNQVLISGVTDLQIQLGEDTTGDRVANRYVSPDLVGNWANVYVAKIWLLMRSDKVQKGVDTEKSFDIAGAGSVDYGGLDDYRYFMVTSTVNLRNARPVQ